MHYKYINICYNNNWDKGLENLMEYWYLNPENLMKLVVMDVG